MKYHDHFDHLGQLRAGDLQGWEPFDKVVAVCLAIVILALMAGSI